jgi:hypothetical protein
VLIHEISYKSLLRAAQWSMWDRIQSVRGEELHTLWRSFIVQALFGFTLNTIPVLVSVLTFGAYVLLGNRLTASKAFTSLSLFTVRAALSAGRPCTRLMNVSHALLGKPSRAMVREKQDKAQSDLIR